LTDVLAGAAMGVFYGWLIPTLHKRTNKENGLSFFFTGNGFLISFTKSHI
jgi:NhaP-type Na+/H+ and K+/H+ antiporter